MVSNQVLKIATLILFLFTLSACQTAHIFLPNGPTISNFCEELRAESAHNLTRMSPTLYIEQSPNRAYLDIWKRLFIKLNGISEDYFNEHIRIREDRHRVEKYYSAKNELIDYPYFAVDFIYILDWASIYGYNRFMTDKSTEEILQFLSRSNQLAKDVPQYESLSSNLNGISDMRMDGKLVSPLKCEKVLYRLASRDPYLVPDSRVASYPNDFVIFGSGERAACAASKGRNTVYSRAKISIISGEISYFQDHSLGSCPVY